MNNRVLNRITGVLDVLEVFEDRVVLTPRGVQGRLMHGLAPRSFDFAALNSTR